LSKRVPTRPSLEQVCINFMASKIIVGAGAQGCLSQSIHSAIDILEALEDGNGIPTSAAIRKKLYINVLCQCTRGNLAIKDTVLKLLPSSTKTITPRESLNLALTTASALGDVRMIQSLVMRGANANSKMKPFVSPMDAAALNGHYEALIILLEHAPLTDSCWLSACAGGSTNIVKMLFDRELEVEDLPYSMSKMIMKSIKHGHIELLQSLLLEATKKGINTPSLQQNSFLYSCGFPYVKIVSAFLDMGTDMYAWYNRGNDAMEIASRAGEIQVVELLIARGFDPERERCKDFRNALMLASE